MKLAEKIRMRLKADQPELLNKAKERFIKIAKKECKKNNHGFAVGSKNHIHMFYETYPLLEGMHGPTKVEFIMFVEENGFKYTLFNHMGALNDYDRPEYTGAIEIDLLQD